MRFQSIIATSLAAAAAVLASPNAVPKVGVDRFEAPLVPRGCPGGGPSNACPAGFFQVRRLAICLAVLTLLDGSASASASSAVESASETSPANCPIAKVRGTWVSIAISLVFEDPSSESDVYL
ncbi:hypothetical protein AURDEDRAFT_127956 [Auricularia subglabra TFB-10046 SS5]|nr:hypothetical protein AURDEDRAFT_127956 [Auricularia subglabra TFB-10046 SS5]